MMMFKQVRVSLAVAAAAAVVAAAVNGGWGALEAMATALQTALAGSLMLQGLLLTSVAPTAMAAGWRVLAWVQLALQALLCSSVHVAVAQQAVHGAVLRYLECRGVSSTGAATVTLARDQDLTAAQRLALLKQRMVTAGTACVLRSVAMVSPRGMPAVVTTPGGRLVVVVLGAADLSSDAPGPVSLYTLGRNAHGDLVHFLQDIAQTYGRPAHENPAAVYVPEPATGGWTWRRSREIPDRTRNTLALPGSLLDDLLGDARGFFGAAETYAARRQPFRRGWLLHGPPGTGKSTVPLVVAAELQVPVCVLDLGAAQITDAVLMDLLARVPVPAVVLMEDVDAAAGAVVQRRSTASLALTAAPAPRLSLATLLNALDGVVAGEGRLVIMTTNNPSQLDDALTRPGRCDLVIQLPAASAEVVRALALAECPDASPEDLDELVAVVEPDRTCPAAIVQLLARAGGNLRGLLDVVATEGGARDLVRRGIPLGAERVVPKPQNLHQVLWSSGVEHFYGASVAFGRGFEGEDTMDADCAEAVMEPNWAGYASLNVAMAETIKPDVVAFMFLQYFPRENDAARAFAAKIAAWQGPKMLSGRIRHHLGMNADSATKAVASMDDWLLKYDRPVAANLYQPARVDRVLYYFGAPVDDRMEVLVRALAAAGCRNGDELVSGQTASSQQAVLREAAQAAGTPADMYMSLDRSASVIEAVRKHYKIGATKATPMFRPDIARGFMDAFAMDWPTAMDAARRVTSCNGRSGFSKRNVCALVTSYRDLDACVRAMLDLQARFGFGPGATAPAV